MVAEQNTLFDIPSEEKNPDPIIPIEGLILLLLRLGAEGVNNPEAFAIYSTDSLYQEMKICIAAAAIERKARIFIFLSLYK